MHLNTLSPAPGSTKAAKRVGRGIGSGSGKTSGSGHKGQKSRSGGTVRPGFEGGQMPLQRRLPKFGFKSRKSRFSDEVRVADIGRVEGDVVDLTSLKAAGLVHSQARRVKIILSGELSRAVTVKDAIPTRGAKAAIEAAGGSVEV